ncbi:MAG: secretin and TonB N-terminal domain-containing protein, partial [Alphaproteobacteria bacterium]|nr:secretin and TonB N-terminal domain-containing protein [Alphaproteobacteria bacterium]
MMIGSRRSTLLLSSALAALTMFWLGGAARADDQTYQFDIPSEPLGQALTDFSRASSLQIVFSEEATRGRATNGLHGRYTAARALTLLLAGSDLQVETNSSGVVMVRSKNAVAASSEGAAPADSNGVETVVVTGSRLPQTGAGPQDVKTYTQERIERSGQTTVADFLSTIPSASVATGESGLQTAGGATTVQLHGLPFG